MEVPLSSNLGGVHPTSSPVKQEQETLEEANTCSKDSSFHAQNNEQH